MLAKSRFFKGIGRARSYVLQKIDDPLNPTFTFFFQKLILVNFVIKFKLLSCWLLSSPLGFMGPIDFTLKLRPFLSLHNTQDDTLVFVSTFEF